MAGSAEPQLTLVSTTDSLDAVQAALGVTEEKTPTAAQPEAKVETPAVTPPVTEPAKEPETLAVEPKAETEPVKPTRQPRAKDSLQSRIDELVRERDTARGLSAAHEVELAALRKKVDELVNGAAKPEPAATPDPEEAEPKVDDFPDYDTFMKASIQFHARKIARETIASEQAKTKTTETEEQQRQRTQELLQAHEARVADAKTRYEDFDEAVSRPEMMITTVMRDSILLSEIGPDVAYYLANHPEECAKLVKMGDTPLAIKAFGRLEAKVEGELEKSKASAASAPTTATAAPASPATPSSDGVTAPVAAAPAVLAAPAVTRAPDPITSPVTGSVTTTVDPSKMSYAEYKAWREGQLAARAPGARR